MKNRLRITQRQFLTHTLEPERVAANQKLNETTIEAD